MVETSSSTVVVETQGGGSRHKQAPRIPCVGGGCRNVARAITTHYFGLWAADYQPEVIPRRKFPGGKSDRPFGD